MNFIRKAALPLMVFVSVLGSQSALAQHHGGGGHRAHSSPSGHYIGHPAPAFHYAPSVRYYSPPRPVFIAPRIVYGYGYPPPRYYYPPVPRPVYLQQVVPNQSDGYWYFCPQANAYFPYVQSCSGGWQQVLPTPPAPQG